MDFLSLKWDYHCNTLQNAIVKLCGKDDYADTTLFCDGKLFKAHKIVLSACSDFFKDLYDQLVYTIAVKDPVIVLSDIKVNTLEFILSYIYMGEVVIPSEELESLVRAAKFLKIKGIISDTESIVDNLPICQSQNAMKTVAKDLPICDEEDSCLGYSRSQTSQMYQSKDDSCCEPTDILTDSDHERILANKIRVESVESLKYSGKKLDIKKDFARSFVNSSAHELERAQSKEDYMMKEKNDNQLIRYSKIQSDGSNLLALPQNQNSFTRYHENVNLNDDIQINKTGSHMNIVNNSKTSLRSMVVIDKGYTISQLNSQFNASPIGVINSEEFSESKEEPRFISTFENNAFEAKHETFSSQYVEAIDCEKIENEPKEINPSKKDISEAKLKKLEVVLKRVKTKKSKSSPVRRSLRGSVPLTSMKVRKLLHQMDPPVKFATNTLNGRKSRRVRCGKCEGCNAVDCRKCVFCKDRYMNINVKKQCCLYTRCRMLKEKKPVANEEAGYTPEGTSIIEKSQAENYSCNYQSASDVIEKTLDTTPLESSTTKEANISILTDTGAYVNSLATKSSKIYPFSSSKKTKICSDVSLVTDSFSLHAEMANSIPSTIAAVTNINSAIDAVLARYSAEVNATKMAKDTTTMEKSVISSKVEAEIPYYSLEADTAKVAIKSLSSEDATISSDINVVSDKVKSSWRCYLCSKIFPTKMKLQLHLRIHATPYACQFCKFRCHQSEALNVHVMTKHKHSKERPYFCFICSLSFKTCLGLTYHNKSQHA